MIGAVIGDLAAWTWEYDRTCFYERLVAPEARLSEYGLLSITMWPMIHEGGSILQNRLYMTCGKALAHSRIAGIDVPDDWHRWGLTDYDKAMPFELKVSIGIALCGQDKPTQDMALYTGVLFLAFTKTSFNQTE